MYHTLFYSNLKITTEEFKELTKESEKRNSEYDISGFVIVCSRDKLVVEYLQCRDKDNLYNLWSNIMKDNRHDILYKTNILETDYEMEDVNGLTALFINEDNIIDSCLCFIVNQQLALMKSLNTNQISLTDRVKIDSKLLIAYRDLIVRKEHILTEPLYSNTLRTESLDVKELIKTELILRTLVEKVERLEHKVFLGNGTASVTSRLSILETKLAENDEDIGQIRSGCNTPDLISIIKNTGIKSLVTIIILLSLLVSIIDSHVMSRAENLIIESVKGLLE